MDAVGQKTSFAEVNGTKFHFDMAGSGDPVVLLHAGVMPGRRMWDDQLQPLALHSRVIRYDMRGYGDTSSGPGGYSGVEDLYGLLGVLGIEQATLVGCSQGGTIALDFALEHPDMMTALVLVSATPSGYQFEGEPPQKLIEFMGAYQQQDVDRATELAAQVWFDGPRRTPDQASPSGRRRARDLFREVIASRSIDLEGDGSPERPAANRLTEVGVPTLVIAGDQDDPSIVQAAEHLASGIPEAKLVIIPGAGHLVNIEQPGEFNRAVLDFLRR